MNKLVIVATVVVVVVVMVVVAVVVVVSCNYCSYHIEKCFFYINTCLCTSFIEIRS
jgi:hypothetical protein